MRQGNYLRGEQNPAWRHGEGGRGHVSSEYIAWCRMKARCRRGRYHAGRGIIYCERWERFESFLVDMGRKPASHYTLERINNDGNYEPSNCCWATMAAQNRNRCISKLTLNNVRQIRLRRAGGETTYSLSDAFSVSQSLISMIVSGKKWKEEPSDLEDC